MDDKMINKSSRNTTKTDLSLLLECLKCQMKCPNLQKQALLTINLICEKREDNVDLLRELGGVPFVYNLSKSNIVHSDVKETALFTLGTLAEANVYCKNSLCRKEIFVDITGWLVKEDTTLTQKRVLVYLLFVLVANNKSGQTLAQTTGCLDILLDLFRTTFSFTKGDNLRTVSQTYKLWASVSSALCGCVNNPQNEEGQRICVSAFPIIETWLGQISLPRTEIFQPICSFIAMTVANNSCVQESFSASGGLKTLTVALVRLASAADTSSLSCQLSVIISKTLSACISDNCTLASSLAQYEVVPHLLSLLTSSHLDPDDLLSVLLSISQCTDASVEHQSQLVLCGGLSHIITLLTNDTNEEIRKAATFVLQTCKQATMCLRGNVLIEKEAEHEEPLADSEVFKNSAQELLRQITLLEKNQLKPAEDDLEDTNLPNSTEGQGQCPQSRALSPPLQKMESMKSIHTLKHVPEGSDSSSEYIQTVLDICNKDNYSDMKKKTNGITPWEVMTGNRGREVWSPTCKERTLVYSSVRSLEGGGEPQTKKKQPKDIECTDELKEREISRLGKIPAEEQHSVSHIRCTGCVFSFEELTSRTFASLQALCRNSCDMHRVLQKATERFKLRFRNSDLMKEHQVITMDCTTTNAPRVSSTESQRSLENLSRNSKNALLQNSWRKHNDISLTPLRRRATKETFTSQSRTGLAPLKRQHLAEDRHPASDWAERRQRNKSGHEAFEDHSKRRKRQEFSQEEVSYLLSGVNKHGFSWNSILWSYPFQPGRTNVDLAKKYRRLMKCKCNDDACV